MTDRKTPADFWLVQWGADDAKGDTKLPLYFVRFPEFDRIKSGELRYVIGRKGTGKTAVVEQIIHEIQGDFDKAYKYLSLKDFPIQYLRNMKDKAYGDKSQYVPIWSFLIMNEVCRMIINDESSSPGDVVNGIREYLNVNFPHDGGFSETVTKLKSTENKLSFLPEWFGGSQGDSRSEQSVNLIHYQRVYELLVEQVKLINTNSTYYILFDELDEGYSQKDEGLRLLLLSLLRAVENSYRDLNKYLNYIPILALRSDIYDGLYDNDLNKLDDYVLRIKWNSDSIARHSLHAMVNKRISASIEGMDENDAWSSVVVNHDPALPGKVKSVWDYIQSRTFERPRDVVKFMKYCKALNRRGKLTFDVVKSAEVDYSDWFFRELRDEIHSHLPVWKEAGQCIMRLGKGVFTVDDIRTEFEEDSDVGSWMENNNRKVEDVLKILFDFSMIGTLDPNTNRWTFKYKDLDLSFNKRHKMILHYGFSKKFRIRPSS